MSRRRLALPAPASRTPLLLTPPFTPPRLHDAPRRASIGSQHDNDFPSFVKREKAKTAPTEPVRLCKHCGFPRRGHTVSGCPNVYPPIAPKGFEDIWDEYVLPTIERNERLEYVKERLRALLDRHPSNVYVMSVVADELLWHIKVAYSFRYAADCLHPGISWRGLDNGLLIIGRTEDSVKSYRDRLTRYVAEPDTWEDIVVKHLKMVVQKFGDDMVAWNPARRT